MRMPKPLFRFLGEPGRMKLQFETARLAQHLYESLIEERCAGEEREEEAKRRFPSDISEMSKKLKDADVKIDRPSWFANLLR